MANVLNNFIDRDFYSGAQTAIFIGDLFIDDIFGLEWSVQAGMRPVYSYHSANYDLMLRENELVYGGFTLNFKESAYLYLILKRYGLQRERAGNKAQAILDRSDKSIHRSKQNFVDKNKNNSIVKNDKNKYSAQALSEDPVALTQYYNTTIENVYRYSTLDPNLNKNSSRDDLTVGDFDMSTANALQNMRSFGDGAFEDAAESLEDAIWVQNDPKSTSSDPLNFKNSDIGDTVNPMVRGLQDFPFNITITYGDFSSNLSNHTVNVIRDVMLTGCRKIVDTSGRPIQEQYTFVARRAY